MKLPLLLVNFKTYKQGTGNNAVKLAKICEKVSKQSKKTIAITVQAADIYRVAKQVDIPVFAQHISHMDYDSNTGSILGEDVKQAGAKGTLINHSEKRLRLDIIEKTIAKAKKLRLTTIVCANNPAAGKAISAFNPDFIAVEPPELIGGKISISKAKPKTITESVNKVCDGKRCKKVLVGAGVHTKEDVKKALDLGAVGILVASGVVKAKDPEKILKEFVSVM